MIDATVKDSYVLEVEDNRVLLHLEECDFWVNIDDCDGKEYIQEGAYCKIYITEDFVRVVFEEPEVLTQEEFDRNLKEVKDIMDQIIWE